MKKMDNKNRLAALVLSMALVGSMGVTAFAEEDAAAVGAETAVEEGTKEQSAEESTKEETEEATGQEAAEQEATEQEVTEEDAAAPESLPMLELVPAEETVVEEKAVEAVAEAKAAVPEKDTTISLRPEGPAVGVSGNFDYAAAYNEAGITFGGKTISVDEQTLLDYLNNPANNESITALTHSISGKDYIFVGLKFDKPDDVEAKKANVGQDTFDLAKSGVEGMVITYYGVAAKENGKWTVPGTKEFGETVIEWQDQDGTAVATTKVTIKREVTPAKDTSKAGTVSVRPEGPANGVDGTFDYAAAYNKAGITLSGNTVKVDEKTLETYLNDPANAGTATALANGDNIYIGLVLGQPSDAGIKKVSVKKANWSSAKDFTLADGDEMNAGTDLLGGKIIQYLPVAEKDSTGKWSAMTSAAYDEITCTWKNDSGDEVTTTTYNLNREVTPTEAPIPPKPDKPSTGGGGGGGRHEHPSERGESSKGSSSTTTTSKASTSAPVSASAVADAPRNADGAVVRLNSVNAYTTPADLAKAAEGLKAGEKLVLRTVENGVVTTQITIDPAAASKLTAEKIELGMKANFAPTQNHFEKYFKNTVEVLALKQKATFGVPVSIAVKMDLSKLDTGKLMAYTYNPETNVYNAIAEKPWVDANGYMRLNTSAAGHLIITDSPLVRK